MNVQDRDEGGAGTSYSMDRRLFQYFFPLATVCFARRSIAAASSSTTSSSTAFLFFVLVDLAVIVLEFSLVTAFALAPFLSASRKVGMYCSTCVLIRSRSSSSGSKNRSTRPATFTARVASLLSSSFLVSSSRSPLACSL